MSQRISIRQSRAVRAYLSFSAQDNLLYWKLATWVLCFVAHKKGTCTTIESAGKGLSIHSAQPAQESYPWYIVKTKVTLKFYEVLLVEVYFSSMIIQYNNKMQKFVIFGKENSKHNKQIRAANKF